MRQPTSQLRYRSPSWFQGCPVTKLLCFTSVAFFVILKSNTDSIALQYRHVVQQREVYRLFTFMLTFSSLGELLLGLLIFVPLSKRFEREYGTEGFLRLLMKNSFLATVMTCFFLSGNTRFATGFYPIIGTLLHLYKTYTPRLHPKFISILGFDFSEKALTYIFAIQFMGNQGVASAIPFGSGYLAGFLITHPFSPFRKWNFKIPKWMHNIGHGIGKATGLEDLSHAPSYVPASISRSMDVMRSRSMVRGEFSNDHNSSSHSNNFSSAQRRPPLLVPGAPPYSRGYDTLHHQQPQQQQQQHETFERMPVPDPPSPEAIETLTAMGFERVAVIRALRLCDNNVEHAANRLLSGA